MAAGVGAFAPTASGWAFDANPSRERRDTRTRTSARRRGMKCDAGDPALAQSIRGNGVQVQSVFGALNKVAKTSGVDDQIAYCRRYPGLHSGVGPIVIGPPKVTSQP